MSKKPSAEGQGQQYVCQSCGHAVQAPAAPQAPCPNCGQTSWATTDAGPDSKPVGSI